MASIKDLIDLYPSDIRGMTKKELSKVVSQLASAANKRLKRLAATPMGGESRAYKTAMKRGKFSVKGKDKNALWNEYKRVRQFLGSKTSTVKGFKEFRAETTNRIGGGFANEDGEKAFWRAYRGMAESEKALVKSYGSSDTQRFLHNTWENQKELTEDEIERYKDLFPDDTRDLTDLNQRDIGIIRTLIELGDFYESKESEQDGSNSAFFTIGEEEEDI